MTLSPFLIHTYAPFFDFEAFLRALLDFSHVFASSNIPVLINDETSFLAASELCNTLFVTIVFQQGSLEHSETRIVSLFLCTALPVVICLFTKVSHPTLLYLAVFKSFSGLPLVPVLWSSLTWAVSSLEWIG